MKEKRTSNDRQIPSLVGKHHTVTVQYTNKDAQERLFHFIKGAGKDVNAHELAVDFYAENNEFAAGFQVYSVIHVLEDIIKHILSRDRIEPSEQLELPLNIRELRMPQYVPYHAETGQVRYIAAADAQWFHLDAWRDAARRGYQRRTKRQKSIENIVRFFEPYMKGTKVTVRHVCETLKVAGKPN